MIVLFGASGYVGQAFADELRRRRTPFIPLNRQTLDCTDFDRLFDYLRQMQPTFVINAAGFTGVTAEGENSQEYRALTLEANMVVPQNLARACSMTSTPLGHVSSGAIFCGGKLALKRGVHMMRDLGRPLLRRLLERRSRLIGGFTELDEPNCTFRNPPSSFYSGTKALAEELLADWNQVYIWRPGVIFDEMAHPRNFLSGFHCSMEAADSLNSFTHRGDFVRACLDLWESRAPFGTYNVVNPGPLTPRKIMETIRRLFKDGRHEGLLDGRCCASMVESILPRPTGCVLDASKLNYTAGIRMRPAVQSVEDSIRRWRPMVNGMVHKQWSMRPGPANGWGRFLSGTVAPES